MPFIVAYRSLSKGRRYVFSEGARGFNGTTSRLLAKEHRTRRAAMRVAARLRSDGFSDIVIEERTTLAQEAHGSAQ